MSPTYLFCLLVIHPSTPAYNVHPFKSQNTHIRLPSVGSRLLPKVGAATSSSSSIPRSWIPSGLFGLGSAGGCIPGRWARCSAARRAPLHLAGLRIFPLRVALTGVVMVLPPAVPAPKQRHLRCAVTGSGLGASVLFRASFSGFRHGHAGYPTFLA